MARRGRALRVDARWLTVAFLLLAGTPAFAHTQQGVALGFVSGFTHPLTGVDHMLAMIAVGIWGTQLGQPAIWLLPVTFPLVMSVGGALGVRGVPLPGVEIVVAGSAAVLGLMIILNAKPRLAWAATIVALFAICHGYAHGVELPHAADPLAYGVGFVLVTGLLHAVGIAFGLMDRWPAGRLVLRGMGGVISIIGVYLLAGIVR